MLHQLLTYDFRASAQPMQIRRLRFGKVNKPTTRLTFSVYRRPRIVQGRPASGPILYCNEPPLPRIYLLTNPQDKFEGNKNVQSINEAEAEHIFGKKAYLTWVYTHTHTHTYHPLPPLPHTTSEHTNVCT